MMDKVKIFEHEPLDAERKPKKEEKTKWDAVEGLGKAKMKDCLKRNAVLWGKIYVYISSFQIIKNPFG